VRIVYSKTKALFLITGKGLMGFAFAVLPKE
jgi:hypothetical protein